MSQIFSIEYFYISNAWEKVGTATIDLSNYYTKTESDAITDALDDKIDQEIEDREAAIAAHTNSLTIKTELANKEGLYKSLWDIQGALESEFLKMVEKEVVE